ncbi:MAG: hypothetical protein ACLQVD_20950 [Capsulimonadaceae bacterium]
MHKPACWIVVLAAASLFVTAAKSNPRQSTVAAKASFTVIEATDPLLKSAIPASHKAAAATLIGKTGAFVGTVANVYRSHDVVILDFDKNYRSALTAVVKSQSISKLPALAPLLNVRVLVSGQFVSYRGNPEIDIDNPGQIKIVQGGSTDPRRDATH